MTGMEQATCNEIGFLQLTEITKPQNGAETLDITHLNSVLGICTLQVKEPL